MKLQYIVKEFGESLETEAKKFVQRRLAGPNYRYFKNVYNIIISP